MAKNSKKSKVATEPQAVGPQTAPRFQWTPRWLTVAGGLAALLLLLFLYSPALSGPFLFDDFGLPFAAPSSAEAPISRWLIGVRPILMLSYWINYQVAGKDPSLYHFVNPVLHAISGVLVYLLTKQILQKFGADRRRIIQCAAVAAILFLVHPLQTESVAYIAGRSEVLCAVFELGALVIFTRAGDVISWRSALSILLLYALASASKEQAVVLPLVFLSFDIVCRRKSLREALTTNARLYVPIAIAGLIGAAGVVFVLVRSTSAGFNVKGLTWYSYLFTQFRMWLLYLRLSLVPFGQKLDYDVPLSRTILEHGSAFALIGLTALAAAAWRFRNRWPVAFLGLLLFAITLAPTSSVIPIQDLAAERRMYLPLAGLVIAAADLLFRIRWTEVVVGGLGVLAVTFAALTYARSSLWGSDISFWSHEVAESPAKECGYVHLALAYVRSNRCREAVRVAEDAPAAVRDMPELLGVLGHAYTCDHRIPDALSAFERASTISPSVGRLLALATAYVKAGEYERAQVAEQRAMQIPPRTPYDYTMLDAWTKQASRTRLFR